MLWDKHPKVVWGPQPGQTCKACACSDISAESPPVPPQAHRSLRSGRSVGGSLASFQPPVGRCVLSDLPEGPGVAATTLGPVPVSWGHGRTALVVDSCKEISFLCEFCDSLRLFFFASKLTHKSKVNTNLLKCWTSPQINHVRELCDFLILERLR